MFKVSIQCEPVPTTTLACVASVVWWVVVLCQMETKTEILFILAVLAVCVCAAVSTIPYEFIHLLTQFIYYIRQVIVSE